MSADQFSFVPEHGTAFDRTTLDKQALPLACENAPDPDYYDPEFLFEDTWHNFNDYYPFFTLRDVDWQQQWDRYRPLVTSTTNEEALFNILKEMLSPIDDGHIFIRAETDSFVDDFSPGVNRGWGAKIAAILKDDADVDIDEANGEVLLTFLESVINYYGGDDVQFHFPEDKQAPIVWGH